MKTELYSLAVAVVAIVVAGTAFSGCRSHPYGVAAKNSSQEPTYEPAQKSGGTARTASAERRARSATPAKKASAADVVVTEEDFRICADLSDPILRRLARHLPIVENTRANRNSGCEYLLTSGSRLSSERIRLEFYDLRSNERLFTVTRWKREVSPRQLAAEIRSKIFASVVKRVAQNGKKIYVVGPATVSKRFCTGMQARKWTCIPVAGFESVPYEENERAAQFLVMFSGQRRDNSGRVRSAGATVFDLNAEEAIFEYHKKNLSTAEFIANLVEILNAASDDGKKAAKKTEKKAAREKKGVPATTPAPEPALESEAVTEPELAPEAVTESEAVTEPEPAPEAETESEAVTEPEPAPEAVTESEAVAEPEPVTEPEAETESEAETEPEPAPEPASEFDAVTEPETAAKPEAEDELEAEAFAEPEAEASAARFRRSADE